MWISVFVEESSRSGLSNGQLLKISLLKTLKQTTSSKFKDFWGRKGVRMSAGCAAEVVQSGLQKKPAGATHISPQLSQQNPSIIPTSPHSSACRTPTSSPHLPTAQHAEPPHHHHISPHFSLQNPSISSTSPHSSACNPQHQLHISSQISLQNPSRSNVRMPGITKPCLIHGDCSDTSPSPGGAPQVSFWETKIPLRSRGEDLVELMMIQNAQMHQVIMNNMTMSALSAFGYSQTPPSPEALSLPVSVEDEDPEVYHHHYPPVSTPSYPAWLPLCHPHPHPHHQPTIVYQDPIEHQDLGPSPRRDRRAVPPPPPPSAAGTVGADVPPATEYYDAERML